MATLAAYNPGHGKKPLVLDENKAFLAAAIAVSLRVWTHALARVQGRPEAIPGQIP